MVAVQEVKVNLKGRADDIGQWEHKEQSQNK